jgi:hypothetical protein
MSLTSWDKLGRQSSAVAITRSRSACNDARSFLNCSGVSSSLGRASGVSSSVTCPSGLVALVPLLLRMPSWLSGIDPPVRPSN